jgi:hypothetical protein
MAVTRMPAQLLKYWSKGGEGGAKINWGVDGDFDRCRTMINQEVSEKGAPLPGSVISGLCATLHKINTGATPGHAPGEDPPRRRA